MQRLLPVSPVPPFLAVRKRTGCRLSGTDYTKIFFFPFSVKPAERVNCPLVERRDSFLSSFNKTGIIRACKTLKESKQSCRDSLVGLLFSFYLLFFCAGSDSACADDFSINTAFRLLATNRCFVFTSAPVFYPSRKPGFAFSFLSFTPALCMHKVSSLQYAFRKNTTPRIGRGSPYL